MKAYRGKSKRKNNGVKLISVSGMSALLSGCFSIDGYKHYYGTDGADVMTGLGNAEGEIFHSSLGADAITGGSYSALVDYSGSNAGVKVYLDGTPSEGGYAEGDVLTDIKSVKGTNFADYIVGSDGYEETFNGKAGDDILIGGKGRDLFWGDEGDDKIYGGEGNDLLHGGEGADLLDGGSGVDEVHYNASNAAVKVDLGTGIVSGGHADGDVLISIENVDGSRFDDYLVGSAVDNDIYGYDGVDQIFGLAGDDVLNGGAGDDLIYGGSGDDLLSAEKGNNAFNGGAGTDIVKFYGTEDVRLVFTILKAENSIRMASNLSQEVDLLTSIESVSLYRGYGNEGLVSTDIKSIWSELAADEHAKFSDEADFLNWLGDDGGYNYEGL